MLPTLVLAGSIGLNAWLARDSVPITWNVQFWEPFTLQSGQTLTQSLPLDGSSILSGMRMRVTSNAPVEVEACVLSAPDAEPLTCVTRSTAPTLDGFLYVMLEPLPLSEAYLRLRVLGEGEVVTRIGRGTSITAWVDGAPLDGAVELLALTPLQLRAALQDVRAALRDPALIPLQSLVLLSVALWLAVLLSREV